MWIVRIALRRPYTFVVLALVLLILGPLVILRTPKDIFPNIDIPVISAIWQYNGLSAEEMAGRMITAIERSYTTQVNDIEHIESNSMAGVSLIRLFLYPTANLGAAVAQVLSVSQLMLKSSPPGTTSPVVVSYNASSVPILQLALSGKNLSEQQLYDLGVTYVRVRLATVQGASVTNPYGGKLRTIQVDLDPSALEARGLSPLDVVNAVNVQNLILPAGTSKIGNIEYDVEMNSSPKTVQELNDLPIRTVRNNTVYIRDVAHVRDGSPPQTNIVRVDGKRAVLATIQKSGNASTLDIISRVRELLPRIAAGMPELDIRPLADQSLFVRAAIQGVVREAVIAACLTAVMVLIFLGSWRSTLIIGVSIPLSIVTSIIAFSALGQTINLMTLGGLALAVGMLVDDATVEIENINRNLAQGKELERAILDGAQQIAVPAFVSTLSICIVFVPMFFLTGVAKYLFVPLAEAVVFAMLASYLLSRTLVPTLALYLLKPGGEKFVSGYRRNPFVWLKDRFEEGFQAVRAGYRRMLEACIAHRVAFASCFLLCCVASFALFPWLGEDFFPAVDSGQFKLHLRGPTGTRIEETARLCDEVEGIIRQLIPKDEIVTILDNIGLPNSQINLSYSNSAPIGTSDADIMVNLKPNHAPTANYTHDLRLVLAKRFPDVTFAFLAADMVSQILNFGLPAPIDVQIIGRDEQANRQFASNLQKQLRNIPGIVDLRIQQLFDKPKLHIDVDRTKAQAAGFAQHDVASNLLISLSGSFQTSPTFWLNPSNGVSYLITTQTPQYRLDSLQGLQSIPVNGPGNSRPEILGSLASIRRETGMAVVSHYDVQPLVDIYGSVEGRDLGGVANDIGSVINSNLKDLPRGAELTVRGQIETMRSSFRGLLAGLAFAILLVYLLIVVNFQSWLDPLIIISALPAALAGIVWCLFTTGTTLSVPALTGSIMCMGVATANSILVVSFAKERISEGSASAQAALDAGFTRFRPVLMTALAMIIGMVPLALGLGEGGEQNAPLGRAVIGGLLFATVATLFFVPVVFTLLHRSRRNAAAVSG
jgi:multidrug efflux pump subunit AcrB